MEFNIPAFSQKIKEYRGTRTQAEIADELGINRTTISLLENGKQVPTLEILKIICEKTNTNMDDFFIKKIHDPILLMMGQFKDSDRPKLENVLERIDIRQKYIAIGKRL